MVVVEAEKCRLYVSLGTVVTVYPAASGPVPGQR